MASLRQIRRRIRSIQSTRQIMRAMQLVSGSKFKRAQTRLGQGREMLGFLDGLLDRVRASIAAPGRRRRHRRGLPDAATVIARHPLAAVRPEAPEALVLITSDTGLAGAYNNNLIQLADAQLRGDTARQTPVVFIGKRGHRHFTKRGYRAAGAYLDLAGRPDLVRITAIGQELMTRFLSGEFGGIRLLYAQFVSPSVSQPTVKRWLPIQLDRSTARPLDRERPGGAMSRPAVEPSSRRAPAAVDYIFEPSPEAVLEDLLPRWMIATFQLVLLEAFTSEHGARMIAMKNATDNAQDLLTSLTRQRNRIRQAAITKELSEIVGTAEALK